ncbi:single-stranded DNA-binding protein [uncultured Selenomonas sp.]|uniref:single-stranded DNA-binding protein n=1 Tax=uncultured Selenomonas sp. TaxID=159275 RepID=UPI0028DBFA3E|nr:single-stranded DNA-binding protein [uncultured Selenomonas sp.]
MNKAILLGRLTKAPEIKYTQSGKAVASFTLAIDRRKGANGEKQADFISCVAWEKTAETIGNYCDKGQQIAVEGRIQTRSYDAKDGTKRYATEVVVQSMEFCDSKGGGQNASTSLAAPPEQQGMFDGSRAVSDSDIPF